MVLWVWPFYCCDNIKCKSPNQYFQWLQQTVLRIAEILSPIRLLIILLPVRSNEMKSSSWLTTGRAPQETREHGAIKGKQRGVYNSGYLLPSSFGWLSWLVWRHNLISNSKGIKTGASFSRHCFHVVLIPVILWPYCIEFESLVFEPPLSQAI